jgi:hypothetical protein
VLRDRQRECCFCPTRDSSTSIEYNSSNTFVGEPAMLFCSSQQLEHCATARGGTTWPLFEATGLWLLIGESSRGELAEVTACLGGRELPTTDYSACISLHSSWHLQLACLVETARGRDHGRLDLASRPALNLLLCSLCLGPHDGLSGVDNTSSPSSWLARQLVSSGMLLA